MEFHQLEAFVLVAKEASFSRAAERLHISQPAISTRISNLESELNAPLFEKTTRKIKLTKYGDAFLPYAQRILDMSNEALSLLSSLKDLNSAHLKIGTTNRIATYVLPPILRDYLVKKGLSIVLCKLLCSIVS